MFTDVGAGSISYAGGLTASQLPGGTSGSGGAGPVVTLSGPYALTAADNGTTFVIDSNAADRTITVPAGLPLGFTFSMYCNSTANAIIAQFSGAERLRSGGATTTAAGTARFNGLTDTGYSVTIRKVSITGFANTYWGTFGPVGLLTLA